MGGKKLRSDCHRVVWAMVDSWCVGDDYYATRMNLYNLIFRMVILFCMQLSKIQLVHFGIFWSVLLYIGMYRSRVGKLWREHLFFFWKIPREFLFFAKEGTKRGPMPPLLRKKGAPANFLRGSHQSFDTENTDRVFLRYRYGKYREIPTDTNRKIPTRYATLVFCPKNNNAKWSKVRSVMKRWCSYR